MSALSKLPYGALNEWWINTLSSEQEHFLNCGANAEDPKNHILYRAAVVVGWARRMTPEEVLEHDGVFIKDAMEA
jgi:hypothetical protein